MESKHSVTYGSNSHKLRDDIPPKQKPQDKKIERVVQGDVKIKKKSFMIKVKDALVSEDGTSVRSYIFGDVLIPSLKKLISDIITNGIDIMLYGEARHSTKNNNGSRVSYTKYYDRREDIRSNPRRSDYSYNDIVVSTKAEAERVLDTLEDLIVSYGVASVADFYDTVGVTGQYTDNNYGWSNISSAKTIPTRDGWAIIFPRAMPIDS